MTIIDGEIISTALHGGGIIVHQVNCKRVAGAGLAAAISRKWPDWAIAFKRNAPNLGNCWITQVAPNNLVAVWVASLYAQNGYGTGYRHTDYDAFETALLSLYLQTVGLRGIGRPSGLFSSGHRLRPGRRQLEDHQADDRRAFPRCGPREVPKRAPPLVSHPPANCQPNGDG